jgi:hypothetical protein
MYPSQMAEEIKVAFTETQENLLFEGMPGIGKTEIPEQVARELSEELGYPVAFKRLVMPQYEEVDLKGIPEINERKRTVFYPTEELPYADRDGEAGILLLDEIKSAKPSVMVVGHQLLDSRKLGPLYTLPPKWIVIGTGNLDTDGAFVHVMPTTIISRCARYTVEPHYPDWKKWALDNGTVDPEIISFLDKNPGEFIVFNPDVPATNFALPRTYVKLSNRLRAEKKRGNTLSLEHITARIGEGAGAKFHGWLKIWNEVPDIDAILEGKEKRVPEKVDVQYCVVSSMMAKLIALAKEGKDVIAPSKNGLRYLDKLTSDLVIAFLNDIMQTSFWKKHKKNIIKTEEFATLTKNHARNIVGQLDLT